MNTARFILKLIAAVLALAAAVCCVIAFWDKIEEGFYCLKSKVQGLGCSCGCEHEDYVDWTTE